jgi:MFS transporter, DHA2 family, multidrug resistance protein
MSIISINFKDPKERAQALGIWSSSFAAAVVVGPLLGGTLIDNFGWRSIFFINFPIGLVGVAMAWFFIKESVSDLKEHAFDWWGSITLGISLSALVLVLDKGLDWGWLSFYSSLSYFIFIFFILIFIRIEMKQASPIVDLKFFKNSIFVNTLMNNFIVFMGMMGSMFILPVFIETFLGYNATQTGYVFLPMAVCMVIAAQIGGRLVGRVQPRYVIFVSTIVSSFGFYLFSIYLHAQASVWEVIFPLCVMAFGMGSGMAQRTSVIAAAVPREEIGVASSVLALVRNISGAFGIALFSTILNYSQKAKMLSIGQNSVIHTTNPAIYQQFIAAISLKAQIDSFDTVCFISFLIVFFGSFSALLIKVSKDIPDVKVIVES